MRSRVLLFVLFVAAFAGRTSAAPTVPFIDPAGLPGPLVIVGGGKLPDDARKAFFDLAGKEKAKIVVIPSRHRSTFSTLAIASKPTIPRSRTHSLKQQVSGSLVAIRPR
jgi:hypothetical protein